jgi:Ca-activated chloride channel family protein
LYSSAGLLRAANQQGVTMNNAAIRLRKSVLLCVLGVTASVVYPQKQNSTPPQAPRLPEDDVVRVSTNLVTVPVSVMDRQGRFISNLTQNQFSLYEDGNPQELAYFEGAEKPFTVALVLDTSDSTKFKLNEIQNAAIGFIEQLRPDDRVIIAGFAKQVNVLAEATNDQRRLREAILETKGGGGTSLYNAVDVIVSQRLNHIHGRKAMILFTDGVDTSSLGATYKDTLRAAEELDALVYAIQYNTYDDTVKDATARSFGNNHLSSAQLTTARGESLDVAYDRANRYLRLMTDKSGGRFFYADSADNLRKTFEKIAQELRQQYSISYYPKDGGRAEASQRRIKVRISNFPDVVIRARKSYVHQAAPDKFAKS